MTTQLTRRLRLSRPGAVLLALVLLAGSGCQTFKMSQEDWEKQQRGEVVDPDAAGTVAVVGTIAATGILIGELVAELTRK
jgi:hypothetical protein